MVRQKRKDFVVEKKRKKRIWRTLENSKGKNNRPELCEREREKEKGG